MLRNLGFFLLFLIGDLLVAAPEFDFSEGSDERLYEAFSDAGESYYQGVVAAYGERCESGEGGVRLAVERCRFISYFLYAEDLYFESAEGDYERAMAYLETNYEFAPEAMLFRLEEQYGEAFFEEADRVGNASNLWPAKLRSEYYLLVAERSRWGEEGSEALGPAAQAFRLDANAETAKLYAELLADVGRDEEAVAVLQSVSFAEEDIWVQHGAMKLYLGLGQTDEALALYESIKDEEDLYISQSDIADMIALQGDVMRAREVLREVEIQEWNEEQVLLSRLAFEIKHGDFESAVVAFETYREIGWRVDPFGRKWLEVAMAFGRVPWESFRISGAMASLGVLLLFLCIPFVIIAPIHYWSLSRELSGKVVSWSYGPWGLRTILIVTCSMLAGEFALNWWENEWSLRELFEFETSVLTDQPTLRLIDYVHLNALVSVLVLGAVLYRTRSFSLLKFGSVSIGRAIGYVVLAVIGFRVLTSIHVAIFPDIRTAASEGLTLTMMRDLFAAYGFWGLWLHVGLIGPVVEELLFRGVLLGGISKRIPFWAANLLQASLFTVIHEDMRLAVFYLVFGLVCGWLVKTSGALGTSLLLHVVNNSLVCLGLLLLWGS